MNATKSKNPWQFVVGSYSEKHDAEIGNNSDKGPSPDRRSPALSSLLTIFLA